MTELKSFKGDIWHYEVFGKGAEILIAFHGFGNEASSFRVLEPSLGNRFKIISFNLPYHGKTVTNRESISYTKKDLKQLFAQFFNEQGIGNFSLMGFSLGGKIALQLLELFPERVNDVLLIAPDGLGNNWDAARSGLTNTAIGKNIYKKIIDNPQGFFRIVKMLKSAGLIAPKMEDFVHYHLSTKERRQLVWDVWYCFRQLKPDIRKIQQIINSKKINLHLFFGKYDSVIPPSIGKKFVEGLENKNALHVIESGHNLLREKLNAELSRVIK